MIATEACRAGCQADSFRDRVASETGTGSRLIDRETEATLAGWAARRARRRGAAPPSTSAAARQNWYGSSATAEQNAPRGSRSGGRSRSASSRAEHFGGSDVTPNPCLMVRRSRNIGAVAPSWRGFARHAYAGTPGTVTRSRSPLNLAPTTPPHRGIWMDVDVTRGSSAARMSYQERQQQCISIERADWCCRLRGWTRPRCLPAAASARRRRGLREGMMVERMARTAAPGAMRRVA